MKPEDVSPPPAGYGSRPPEGARAGSGAAQRSARKTWPRWVRRGPMEMLACIIIAAGFLMMLQPLSMTLYTWSFLTTLTGTLMFMIVSKFPS